MGLEYAAGSALGDLRALAAPASLQTVSLSRGVEDDASFASLAARQALAAGPAYAAVLAAELVGAVRAVRLRGLAVPESRLGRRRPACAALPGAARTELADRDLTPDIAAATALLPALARLVSASATKGALGLTTRVRGRSSSAYDTDVRRSAPVRVTTYWPIRHSGGL